MSPDVPMFCCPITDPCVLILSTSFMPIFPDVFSCDSLSTSTPTQGSQALILLNAGKTRIITMINNISSANIRKSLCSVRIDNGGNVRNANVGGPRDLLSLSFSSLLGVFFGFFTKCYISQLLSSPHGQEQALSLHKKLFPPLRGGGKGEGAPDLISGYPHLPPPSRGREIPRGAPRCTFLL